MNCTGADSRGLAKPLAYTTIRNLHEQHFRAGQEQIKQAMSLVDHGKGKLDELDRAYVLSIAASFAELHGQISQAESLAEQSVKILSPLHGDWQRVAYLHVLVKLSGYQVKNGKEKAALATAQTGVTLSAQVVGPQSLMHTLYVMTVGDVMLVHGDYVGGRDALQTAVAALRQRDDARGLLVFSLDALADCNRGLGDPEAARSLSLGALDLVRKNTGQKARIGISVQMALLADADREIGRYEDARCSEQILAQEDSVPGSEQNPHLYAPLANLGALALRSGNVEAAEKYYTRTASGADCHGKGKSTATVLKTPQRSVKLRWHAVIPPRPNTACKPRKICWQKVLDGNPRRICRFIASLHSLRHSIRTKPKALLRLRQKVEAQRALLFEPIVAGARRRAGAAIQACAGFVCWRVAGAGRRPQ